jgi:hypothetical protein
MTFASPDARVFAGRVCSVQDPTTRLPRAFIDHDLGKFVAWNSCKKAKRTVSQYTLRLKAKKRTDRCLLVDITDYNAAATLTTIARQCHRRRLRRQTDAKSLKTSKQLNSTIGRRSEMILGQ